MLANGVDVADACCFGVGRIAAPKRSGSPAPVSSPGLGAPPPPPKRDAALPIDMAFVLRAVPEVASFAAVDVAAAVSELPVALP